MTAAITDLVLREATAVYVGRQPRQDANGREVRHVTATEARERNDLLMTMLRAERAIRERHSRQRAVA